MNEFEEKLKIYLSEIPYPGEDMVGPRPPHLSKLGEDEYIAKVRKSLHVEAAMVLRSLHISWAHYDTINTLVDELISIRGFFGGQVAESKVTRAINYLARHGLVEVQGTRVRMIKGTSRNLL